MRSLLVFILLTATAHVLAAQGTSASAELKALLQQADSLKGEFRQQLYDRDHNLLQETEGRFVLQRPENFYWETFPPYQQIVVGNGEKLWVYDPDLEQVTVHDQAQQQQASPAQILSGDLDGLNEQYQITSEGDDDQRQFTLVDRNGEGMFARLELNYKDGVLAGLSFEDNLGQVTELSFSKLEMNPEVDAKLFQFKAPAGVDVIVDD